MNGLMQLPVQKTFSNMDNRFDYLSLSTAYFSEKNY